VSFEAKKRRRLLRGVRRAAGPELAAVLRGEGWAPAPVADEDLERLWRRAKLGADLGEEIAALDAARRLRPRDKGHEFFRLPKGSSMIRLVDGDGSKITNESARDRMDRWYRGVAAERAHFVVVDDEIKTPRPPDP
jgi:hypothetical protein